MVSAASCAERFAGLNLECSDALAIAISVNNFSKMDKVFSKDSNENNLNKAIKSALLKEDNNRKN